jgi:CheY-like chemotaxis protein
MGGMRFDVILCDLMMPRVNGMEFHDQVLRRDPDQARRIVFMDGGAFMSNAIEFLRSTSNRRIGKPFDPQELRQVVNELLAELGPVEGYAGAQTAQGRLSGGASPPRSR